MATTIFARHWCPRAGALAALGFAFACADRQPKPAPAPAGHPSHERLLPSATTPSSVVARTDAGAGPPSIAATTVEPTPSHVAGGRDVIDIAIMQNTLYAIAHDPNGATILERAPVDGSSPAVTLAALGPRLSMLRVVGRNLYVVENLHPTGDSVGPSRIVRVNEKDEIVEVARSPGDIFGVGGDEHRLAWLNTPYPDTRAVLRIRTGADARTYKLPDGAINPFVFVASDVAYITRGASWVFAVSTASGAPREVAHLEREVFLPISVSSDQRSLLGFARKGSDGPSDIVAIPLAGGPPTRLAEGLRDVWSKSAYAPQDGSVYFTTLRVREPDACGSVQKWTIGAKGPVTLATCRKRLRGSVAVDDTHVYFGEGDEVLRLPR
jgi:hypothetical protein